MKRLAPCVVIVISGLIGLLHAQEISIPDDLIGTYLDNRDVYLMIAPPADETYVQDMRGSIFTFDGKTFDSGFLENLTGVKNGDVIYYPVTLAEDPDTRDRLIYNSIGELIWRVPAPSTYSPSGSERGINYPLGADDPACAPSLVANEILATGVKGTPDVVKAGFLRYKAVGWEMVYNPATKEVWHLQPLR